MSENNLKWVCGPGEDEEIWGASEYFDTKEEAIEAGYSFLTKSAKLKLLLVSS